MIERRSLILTVDSDSDTLTSLHSMLDRKGNLVATRSSAVDALRFASEHKPDAAIVGQPEPGVDATTLVQKLQEVSPETRIIRLVKRGHSGDVLNFVQRSLGPIEALSGLRDDV